MEKIILSIHIKKYLMHIVCETLANKKYVKELDKDHEENTQ